MLKSFTRNPKHILLPVLAVATAMQGCWIGAGGFNTGVFCRQLPAITFPAVAAGARRVTSGPVRLNLTSLVPADREGRGFGGLSADNVVHFVSMTWTAFEGITDFEFADTITGTIRVPAVVIMPTDGSVADADAGPPDAAVEVGDAGPGPLSPQDILSYVHNGPAPSPLVMPMNSMFDASELLGRDAAELEFVVTGASLPTTSFRIRPALCLEITSSSTLGL